MKLKKLIKKSFIAFTCMAMCLSFTACSSSANNSSSSSSKNSTSSTDKSDLSNTLVYAGESEETINPILNSHDELPNIIFSGLMKYDAKGEPILDLASDYKYDENSKTYTFTLRDNVKWHDGKDFTADDVVFTYKLLTEDKTLSSSITSNYQDIESIKKVDDNTVEIKMAKENAAMLGYFTMGIVPKHLLDGEDINTTSFNQHPVGTGRYKFVSWDTSGGMISLEKNTDYYDKVPNIDKVIYKTVSVESTKASMLKAGEADLAWLNANYADTFRNDDNYVNYDFTTADYRAMAMDFHTDFWKKNKDSIGVLNYALDKKAILNGAIAGRGEVAYSPIQLNNYGGNTEADIYSYDLNKFDKEMNKLGWKKGDDGIYERNGQKYSFTIQVRDYEEERVDIAKLCSDQLKKAGIDMQVKLVSKFDWECGYNGFLYGGAAQFDPDMVYAGFVTDASDNNMAYSNKKVDKLLDEGRHTTGKTERKKIYGEFEVEYAKEPGQVLIDYLEGNYVAVKGVKGLDTSRVLGHHAVGVMWNIEDWKIER